MNSRVTSILSGVFAVFLLWVGNSNSVYAKDAFANINGMKMHYSVTGSGEPLLLLHWYGSSGSQAWRPFLNEFESKYMVVLPDLRGHEKLHNGP